MQFAKQEIRKRIIDAAREEFLKNGFQNASIRTITAQAKTSKSNLYNYFADKDALFQAVVEPTLSAIRQGLSVAMARNVSASPETYTLESQGEYIRIVMEFVYRNIADVKLLLFHAAGSSLEGFRVEVLDAFTDVLVDWLAKAMPDRTVSRFFVRCVASFYLKSIEELLLNDIPGEQVGMHFHEIITFVYGGWHAVMQKAPKIQEE